jgi:hypothetical protein
MALVVILRDDEIEGAVIGARIDRVGGNRAENVDALGLCELDGNRRIL